MIKKKERNDWFIFVLKIGLWDNSLLFVWFLYKYKIIGFYKS